MYARIVLFTLGSGKRSTAEEIADTLIPAIKTQNGCEAAMSVIDDEGGEYGLVVLWASKDDAEAAAKVIGPRLRSALQDVAAEPPSLRLMEVYEPNTQSAKNPRFISEVAIPQPNMMKLSPDSRRLYVTNSILCSLDGDVEFGAWLIHVGPDGMRIDDRFKPDFGSFPTGPARTTCSSGSHRGGAARQVPPGARFAYGESLIVVENFFEELKAKVGETGCCC